MLTVVSPHLDDAVLSTWSALRSTPGATVVTAFAGLPQRDRPVAQWDRRCGYTDPHEAGLARRSADVEALRRCGATPVHLEHLDIDYRTTSPQATLRELTRQLQDLLAGAADVWLPVTVGLHPDHRLAARAALAAVDRRHSRVHVYADQPYASVWGWPSWVTDGGEPRMPAPWTRFPLRARTRTPEMQWSAALAYLGLPRTLPNVVRALSAEEVDAKLHALEPYREQLDQLTYGPCGSWTVREALGYESWWDLPLTSRSSSS